MSRRRERQRSPPRTVTWNDFDGDAAVKELVDHAVVNFAPGFAAHLAANYNQPSDFSLGDVGGISNRYEECSFAPMHTHPLNAVQHCNPGVGEPGCLEEVLAGVMTFTLMIEDEQFQHRKEEDERYFRSYAGGVLGDAPFELGRIKTEVFSAVFGFPAEMSQQLAMALGESRPVRKRIAKDCEFLDAFVAAIPCFRGFSRSFYAESLRNAHWDLVVKDPVAWKKLTEDSEEALEEALAMTSKAAGTLLRVFAQKSAPYRDHCRQLREQGLIVPMEELLKMIDLLLLLQDSGFEEGRWDDVIRDLRAMSEWLDLSYRLRCGDRPLKGPPFDVLAHNLRSWGKADDLCDNCTEVPAQRRCGRCKVAHYCTPECQRTAWKAGHKETCFDAADAGTIAARGGVEPWAFDLKTMLHLDAAHT
ncbi:hypothetical protein DFJ74DRAFT_706390 [Hyaloraphidium curvatum]|nr:hypothetical protein DFJ74DRAFT_706390 [Hyaloraphidium curvatum]